MSNLLKSASVQVKGDGEKRVINSNELIAARMQKLAELLSMEDENYFADDFTEGLEAEQVEALLSDPDEVEEDLNEARESASKIIEEANAQAQAIIENAQTQASGIMDNAANEAEAARQEAVVQGHDEGYKRGYDEAMAAGMEEIEALKEELQREKEETANEYQKKYEEMEPELVEILTDIYEHVLGISLSDNSDMIMHLLKETIRNVEGSKNFMLHVSTDDYAFISAYREELMNCVGGIDTLDIIEDMTLAQSNCFIECESGIYDCSLGTELSNLKKELRLLSYHK
ncbi:MAG: hypothetical protein K5931_10920 [Lachnospiraceae bacterium]|nr:hypothetical protein [Lachnospiraceae bacterium]